MNKKRRPNVMAVPASFGQMLSHVLHISACGHVEAAIVFS